jgi:transcription-repair coupling factor (superfamily II helicase)
LISKILDYAGRLTICGLPEGADALLLKELAESFAQSDAHKGQTLLHITRDDARLFALKDALAFFAPSCEVLVFPAWDCLPYDRISPNPTLSAQRMRTLAHLAATNSRATRIVLTTVNAVSQRVPSRDNISETSLSARIGDQLDTAKVISYLSMNGYTRSATVMDPGEFAVRGGIIDIFPPGADEPVRLDFFGDTLDGIRAFDPLTQVSTEKLQNLELVSASEASLRDETVSRFRQGYRELFGAVVGSDPLYEAISEGRKYQGMEHWLPLFHEKMETLFDYVPGAFISLDALAEEAFAERIDAVTDHYQAREDHRLLEKDSPYKPLPTALLYISNEEWSDQLEDHEARAFNPYQLPPADHVVDYGARQGRDFAPERTQQNVNVYDALRDHLADSVQQGRRVMIAAYSQGARERLQVVLADHDIAATDYLDQWDGLEKLSKNTVGLTVSRLEHGFETDDFAIVTEQDLLGDRLVRKSSRTRRADNFIAEASSLTEGDYVTHTEHGVGRYDGLQTIDVSGAPHDCVVITYHGDDRLFVPVENIEVLSRYGSHDTVVQLDRLGGQGWQHRKAGLKKRLKEMADELIKLAAARQLKTAPTLPVPDGLYEEFCARFPYHETEDQLRAIEDVTADLQLGQPMDRLVCGDVGFGKTEVALRSAFIAAMDGKQVAIIAPTTLLVRQHYKSFRERFANLPVRIEQLSRLVSTTKAKAVREGLTSGQVDIIIGTHALLAKTIKFSDLGLLIVDEEQHFGVRHKERLKQLRDNVHVLTLTATPIPRTLQLAMTGLRGLSLIATPPVDRLAVRTFVMPFDRLSIREALLRELYRGGQSYYVCPRISDLSEIAAFLHDHVPEVKVATAHGQMPSQELEDVMNAYYDGAYDVLLSTTIIESGLDIPTANTMIIHRADMFGLAQLYQLRGRVGRSKLRAYAYLTTRPGKSLTKSAEKRLKVLQSLDKLGAGFTLASHDLDIRGAGNLLGEEQSGHIREVGVELYQHMLEEAVAQARHESDGTEYEGEQEWSPQVTVGASVLIPETYVPDLGVRLSLYRRIAQLQTLEEIDSLAAEMIDRFGSLPNEVDSLLKIVAIKQHCRLAGISKLDAGPRGGIVTFHNNDFSNPAGLVAFLSGESGTAKLRPDHTLFVKRGWDDEARRIKGANNLAKNLARIANEAD